VSWAALKVIVSEPDNGASSDALCVAPEIDFDLLTAAVQFEPPSKEYSMTN
jgi:hypothetical protein